jgi:hypothetical protein
MSTTPNSPTVCAKLKTVAVSKPGLAKGKATVKNASQGRARKVAATSIGRRPMASNAYWMGCTAKGNEHTMAPKSKPVNENDNKPTPNHWVNMPTQPCGPNNTNR